METAVHLVENRWQLLVLPHGIGQPRYAKDAGIGGDKQDCRGQDADPARHDLGYQRPVAGDAAVLVLDDAHDRIFEPFFRKVRDPGAFAGNLYNLASLIDNLTLVIESPYYRWGRRIIRRIALCWFLHHLAVAFYGGNHAFCRGILESLVNWHDAERNNRNRGVYGQHC